MSNIFLKILPLKQRWLKNISGGTYQLMQCRCIGRVAGAEDHDRPWNATKSNMGKHRDLITSLQQRFDFEPQTMRIWLRNKKRILLIEDQRFNQERAQFLGDELAAAHFVCAREGSVKFEGNDRWFVKDEKTDQVPFLPNTKTHGMYIEAVDLSKVHIVYEGLDNLLGLTRIKYLNLSGCHFVDDWCLSRLHKFKDSILHLDISECPNITEGGIASLHHLKNLRKLNLANMPKVAYKQLVASQLEEELPNLFISGVDFSKEQTDRELAEAEEIEKKRREWQKVEDFPSGYLEKNLGGLKSFQNLLSVLPETSRGSWLDGWFQPKLKHKEVTEW